MIGSKGDRLKLQSHDEFHPVDLVVGVLTDDEVFQFSARTGRSQFGHLAQEMVHQVLDVLIVAFAFVPGPEGLSPHIVENKGQGSGQEGFW